MLNWEDKVPDFRGTNIIVNQLFDYNDILPILVKNIMTQQESPNIRSRPLNDQATILAQNVLQIIVIPNSRFSHWRNQISSGKQHNFTPFTLASLCLDTAPLAIDFFLKVV